VKFFETQCYYIYSAVSSKLMTLRQRDNGNMNFVYDYRGFLYVVLTARYR